MSDRELDLTVLCELPWAEAWLLKGRLESEGIVAAVSPDHQDSVFGSVPTLDRDTYEVLVETTRLDDAREIAKDILEG